MKLTGIYWILFVMFVNSCSLHSMSKREKWVKRVNQAIEHRESSIKLLKALALQAGGVPALSRKYEKYHEFNETPLHHATLHLVEAKQQRSNFNVVSWLLQQGLSANARCAMGLTPLHTTSSAKVAQLLIKHGADVNAVGPYKIRPLHSAVRADNIKVAQVLLEHGAIINNVIIKTGYGDGAPLHCCRTSEMAQLLLEKGADVHGFNAAGEKPIHLIASHQPESAALLDMLIKHGNSIDERDKHSETPLCKALKSGRTNAVEFLLKRGADTTIVIKEKFGIIEQLMDTVENQKQYKSITGSLEFLRQWYCDNSKNLQLFIERLLQQDAEIAVNYRDRKGWSFARWALFMECPELAAQLIGREQKNNSELIEPINSFEEIVKKYKDHPAVIQHKTYSYYSVNRSLRWKKSD
jgi:ankyrin repeat protein